MNIIGFISNVKAKYRARETDEVVRVADKLASMKRDRVRLEGQKKIYDLESAERTKLASLKREVLKDRFNRSVVGRVVSVVTPKSEVSGGKKKRKVVSAPNFFSDTKSPFALKK